MPEQSFDPIATRHSLLNRLKNWGDQTSWQDFFDTYWQLIYNVAVKAGLSDTEAQEVVQETVIAVARKIGDFKADPAGIPLEAVWQEEWEKHLMAAALERVKGQVSPRQFQMFDLHVRQELSVADTARTLQASVASVYMARYRVARLVKEELARLQQVAK